MNQTHDQAQRTPNRLIHETSPYLLQHAYNPVDWYPWGDEAFAQAKLQDKPVFLSIGYSACHWCHVMEHESFEHPEIAKLMNEHFINIKVDREERPDLDQIYMAAVQLITRRGGWPMSVFLDHERSPFYGGTYWPPVSRHGMPGFADIIQKVGAFWRQKREECLNSSREILEAISSMEFNSSEEHELTQESLIQAGKKLLRSADQQHGGFGGAPKFPHSMDLRVLLRYAFLSQDSEATKIIKLTLDKMCQGGIYDQLGGGFARYATDAHWLVPHFEKMLYDNALLVPAYLEGWQSTADPAYKTVVEETLNYILKEMTSPEGPFYSTQDADSEGIEGKFYVWSQQEIIDTLGREDARIFNFVYDVSAEGNWEEVNILNRPKSWTEITQTLKLTFAELQEILARCRKTLYAVRAQRVWPGRDEKILTSWNGLMITAFAQAGRALVNQHYIQAAEYAAKFILNQMRDADGRLWHSYKDQRARFNAYLDDYSALAEGLLELFQSTGNSSYLEEAVSLLHRMQAQFNDPAGGAYFYTSSDHEQLILRNKESQDNATPSGNTLAATAYIKAYLITGNDTYRVEAQKILTALSAGMTQYPLAYGQGLIAQFLMSCCVKTVIFIQGDSRQEYEQLASMLGARFDPRLLAIWCDQPTYSPSVNNILQGKTVIDGKVTCYICEANSCAPPVSGVEAILELFQ